MHSLIGAWQILAILLMPPAQNSHHEVQARSRVVLFHEVWRRSVCRSMVRMVDVETVYPGWVEHMYSPACVPLRWCSGCCGDEKLECSPILTRNVTMQLLRINPSERAGKYMELTFVEHQACECRPRRIHSNKKSHTSVRKRPTKRKHKKKKKKRTKDCGKCLRPVR